MYNQEAENAKMSEINRILQEAAQKECAKAESEKLAYGNLAGQCGMANSEATSPPSFPGYDICDALNQLVLPRWDGNLNSKSARDRLVRAGLADRTMGWNYLTTKGIEFCITLGILKS